MGFRNSGRPADHNSGAVCVTECTFSTSVDYERFLIKYGRRYHHTLDPARGEPAQGCPGVTIVTGRASVSNGLSTRVFVLGT